MRAQSVTNKTQLEPILGVSSPLTASSLIFIHAPGMELVPFQRALRPTPIRKVSEDLSREAFGLIGLTSLKALLNNLTS